MSEFTVILSCRIYQIKINFCYGHPNDWGIFWFILLIKLCLKLFNWWVSCFDRFYFLFKASNVFHCLFRAFLFKWFKILMSNLAGFFVIPSELKHSIIYSYDRISIYCFSFTFCFGFHPSRNMKFLIAYGSYSFLNVTNDEVGSLLASFLPCWFWIKGKCKYFGIVAPKTLYK